MDPITPGVLLTAGGMAIGFVVWLVRLEGRINLSDARFTDLKDALDEIRSDVKQLLKGDGR